MRTVSYQIENTNKEIENIFKYTHTYTGTHRQLNRDFGVEKPVKFKN